MGKQRFNFLGGSGIAKAKKKGTKRGAPSANENGRAHWFAPGRDDRRNTAGGLPKIFQRARMLALEQLSEPAPDKLAEYLGLAPGSTWNDLRIRALILAACGLHNVDVAAQRELRDVTEGITKRIDLSVVHGTADQLERARKQIWKEMTLGLPSPNKKEETE